MNIPFNGNVSPRLIGKLYKGKVFYNIRTGSDGKYDLFPCILSNDRKWDIEYPCIELLKFGLKNNIVYTKWSNLYEDFKDAKKEVKRRNYLYFNCFKHKPYLSLDILGKFEKQLIYIESQINRCLSGFDNFEGIDFCDVHAGGIQVRGHHKQIKGYTYGDQPTIKYDFSNVEEIIDEFICMWRRIDNSDAILQQKRFIEIGEKYGWD